MSRVQALVSEWAPRLNLGGWLISIQQIDEHQATAEVEPRYHSIKLSVNPARIDEDTDLEELIVHELCHALTWRLWDCADRLVLRHKPPEDHGDHRWWLEECHEEAVTMIALAFVSLKRELLDTEARP
jgi:hypothetical protein